AVLAPAIGPAAGVLVGEVAPGVAAGAVVLAHRAPLALAQVRPPAPPAHPALAILRQPTLLRAHRSCLPGPIASPVSYPPGAGPASAWGFSRVPPRGCRCPCGRWRRLSDATVAAPGADLTTSEARPWLRLGSASGHKRSASGPSQRRGQ